MRAPRLGLLVALAIATAGGGCGKQSPQELSGAANGALAGSEQGAAALQTRNTTRLGGADPVINAAAVAQAVYPGLTAASRPQAVVLVGKSDWTAALAASALASAPLGAPLLYADGERLPGATSSALRALHPLGAKALGGAQVIEIGTSAPLPEGLRSRAVPAGGEPAAVAVAVKHVLDAVAGPSRHVIVLPAGAPPALGMPAAGLAAESGAPILFVTAAGVPGPTASELSGLHRAAIYVLDASAVAPATIAALARFGHVTPIPAVPTPGDQGSPADNAIAVARFTDGAFGWGVKEPGHGLVFANAGQPFDAPASALLSATGDYGPLLLLEAAEGVPPALARYLGDIQPAYGAAPRFAPVHGAYNHGWLIGDAHAISLQTQAELDSMLEIVPRHISAEEEASSSSE